MQPGSTEATQNELQSEIDNAKPCMLCSEMPRFGGIGALQEKQAKDLVARLLVPESPVNKSATISGPQ